MNLRNPFLLVLLFVPLFVVSSLLKVEPHVLREANRLLLVSAATWLGGQAIVRRIVRGNRGFPNIPLTWPFVLLTAVCGFSVLGAARNAYLWDSLRGWTLLVAAAFLYFGLASAQVRKRDLVESFRIVGILGFAITLVAILIHYTAESYADVKDQVDFLPAGEAIRKQVKWTLLVNRARAFFGNANHLAGWTNLFASVPLGYVFWGNRRELRFACIAYLGFHLWLLLLTESRGGLGSFFAAVFLLAAIGWLSSGEHSRGIPWKGIGWAASALLILFILCLVLGGWGDVSWIFQLKTLFPRLSNWRSAFLLWKDHPLLGIGPEMFSEYVPQVRPIGGPQSQYIHNLYLEALAETGLCGLTALLLLQISVIRLLVRRFRELPRGEWYLPAGVLAAVTVYTLHACIDFTHIQPEIMFLAVFFLGVLGNSSLAEMPTPRTPTQPLQGMVLPAAAFASGTLVFWWFLVLAPYPAVQEEESGRAATWADPIRLSEAIGHYGKAVQWAPWDAGLQHDLGYALCLAGRLQEAKVLLLRATRLNPLAGRYRQDLCLAYWRLGEREEAFRSIDEAIRLHPAKADYYFTRARLRRETGDEAGRLDDERLGEERRKADAAWEPNPKMLEGR